MKQTPFFSVVIPVYNRADTLYPTLASVQNQSFQDFECIIIDDGSDDAEALKTVISNLNDGRFKYIRQENGGGGAARNTGIMAAEGQYIAFLDSDDFFVPHKLERCAKHIHATSDKAIYSYVSVDRGVGTYWNRPSRAIRADEDMGEYLFVQNEFIQTSSIVLSADIAKNILFDPMLRKGQDLDLCLRLHAANIRFSMIEESLSIWVDQTETGRTSRTSGYEAPLKWLEKSRPLLTKKAEMGYRATVLFYYMFRNKPLTGLKDLIKGWLVAGVPFRIIARQFLRGMLPKGVYRTIVNCFVSKAGKKI